MSKITLAPDVSGTGTFTIAAPNSNTDRTLTLPDSAGTIATAESTLTQFNASGSAPVFAARAWVNFNGTGTVAIRASGNVSSITDNGTGNYTVNLTTSMPDSNFCTLSNAVFSATLTGGELAATQSFAQSVSAIRVVAFNSSTGGAADMQHFYVSAFR